MKTSINLSVFLIGALFLLVSCSSSASGGKWIKPGAGESEFNKDYQECRKQALQECANTVWPGYVVAKNCVDNFEKDCLNQRGWEYRKP